jgi:ferric-dicitrate binding protein FerR (iron transport regulator)
MTNIPDFINEWITIYLTEKEDLDSVQLKELSRWIKVSPENKKYFEDLQGVWFAGMYHKNRDRYDKERAYERFLSRTKSAGVLNAGIRKKISLRPLLYVAAVIALLLVVSYASYRQGSEILKNKFADVVIEAPLGSRTKMYLPDGTLAWLNAGSKIIYSQGFGP